MVLFIRMIDMAVANAWIIHKFENEGKKGILSLLDFKRSICVAHLKGSSAKLSMGRKRKASGPPCNIKDDIRFDKKAILLQNVNSNADARTNHALLNQLHIVKSVTQHYV